jgi:hypothetical protein
MMEKPYDERCIELFEAERRWWNLKPFARVGKEKLEGIRIGCTGVVARGPFEG